jgi:predicted acyl esterase
MWWGDVAHDQRPTDAYSLVYDTEPIDEELEILGLPRALLRVSADAPRANWFVRLSDVAPDGTVTQVAGRASTEPTASRREARAIEPGVAFLSRSRCISPPGFSRKAIASVSRYRTPNGR